jgi:hypothetical protein
LIAAGSLYEPDILLTKSLASGVAGNYSGFAAAQRARAGVVPQENTFLPIRSVFLSLKPVVFKQTAFSWLADRI